MAIVIEAGNPADAERFLPVLDQPALAGDEVELVAVLHTAGALTMMPACGSNRLTNFSPADTTCPCSTRRWLWASTRSISGR